MRRRCRAEHVSGWAEYRVERSGAWSGRGVAKTMERERSAEREVVERELSGKRAEPAAHSPLQPNISLTSCH